MRLIQQPFIGLWWYALAVKAGLESKLAELIFRMIWVGRRRRLYILLTLPFIVFNSVEAWLGARLEVTLRGAPRRDWWQQLLLQAPPNVDWSLSISGSLLAIVLGLGMRRFLSSESYRLELLATPNSRRELFRAGMASYFPFLMLLFFVAAPLGTAIGVTLGRAQSLWNLPLSFTFEFLGASKFSQRGYVWGSDVAIVVWSLVGRGLAYFSFLFLLFLKLFLVVRAPSAPQGIVHALVVGMAAGTLCDAFRIVGLTILFEVILRSAVPRGAGLHIVLWYVLPVLGLGLVWYRAQRGFEARRMPTEGAE